MKLIYKIKQFSSSFNRKKYIKVMSGYSEEFCHNIVRLIMRPNARSHNHWIDKASTWLYKAVTVSMTTSSRPVLALFDQFLDHLDMDSWNDGWIESMRLQVKLESVYGSIKHPELSYVKDKVIELAKTIQSLSDKNAGMEEVHDAFIDWYKSLK